MSREKMSFLEAMETIDDQFILEASREWTDQSRGKAHKKIRKFKQFLFIAAALTAACAVTAIAADKIGLIHIFEKQFVSQEAQEQIVSRIPVKISGQEHIPSGVIEEGSLDIWNSRPELPDSSALLTIDEYMYDGSMLYICGSATENGKKYSLNADRLYINDIECGPVSTACSAENSSIYSFEVDLSDLDLSGIFIVTLPLSVYDQNNTRYQNQELSFEVNADTASITDQTEDIVFEHEEFTLTIKKLTVTSTIFEIEAEYQMKEDKNRAPVLTLLSEDGTELPFLTASSRDMGSGVICFESRYTGFDGKPEKLNVGTRLVPEGEYVYQYPVLYQDPLP